MSLLLVLLLVLRVLPRAEAMDLVPMCRRLCLLLEMSMRRRLRPLLPRAPERAAPRCPGGLAERPPPLLPRCWR